MSGSQQERSSDGTNNQLRRRDRDSGVTWDHVITAVLLIWFFFGMAIIFADLWIPIIPYLKHGAEVVGDPVLFMLSLVLFLSILWNVTFYLKRRKELWVARKLIMWIASQRNVVSRTDKERERIDRVLKAAIWAIRNSRQVREIIDQLNKGTRRGEVIPEGWARSHYDKAIDCLTDAIGRDKVSAWEERKRDIEEGEKWLWATRAENLRARAIIIRY